MTPDLEIRSETLPISTLTHAVHEERYDPLFKDDPLFVLDQPEERKGLATLVKGEDKVACQREKTPEQMSVSFSEKETTKNIYIAYGTAIFLTLTGYFSMSAPLLKLGPAGVKFRRHASRALSTTSSMRATEKGDDEEEEEVGRSTLG